LIQQLTIETMLITAAGVALGVFLAASLTRVLVATVQSTPGAVFLDTTMDWRMFAAAAALTAATTIAFALIPLRRALTTAPAGALHSRDGWNREQSHVRRGLLVGQIALALALLAASALFVRTLRNLETLDAGFDPAGVIVADINFGDVRL